MPFQPLTEQRYILFWMCVFVIQTDFVIYDQRGIYSS